MVSIPDENPEDYLNIREILMKKRLVESHEDYKDTFSDMKEKLDNKTSSSDYLVGITTDSITISAMKVSYSRENLDKILDFINDISDGEAKL